MKKETEYTSLAEWKAAVEELAQNPTVFSLKATEVRQKVAEGTMTRDEAIAETEAAYRETYLPRLPQ